MRSVEETHPRPGLSVPVVSVLDADGALIDEDQRALVRFVIQDGHGADVIFAAGTTGEWDRVRNDVRQRVVQVCAEEVAKVNSRLGQDLGRGVEAWAGVTAPTARETLENLDFAIAHGADAAVLAPLSIRGIDDPVRFVARDVADLLDARERRIPVYLYDNADIAVDPKVPHIRTRQVKALSRLDFVRGIKVSALAPRARQLHAGRGGLPRPRRVRDLRRQRDADLRAVPPAQRLARRDRRALEPLPAARRPSDRRGRRPGERAAAGVGARLAGVPRRRRRAHGPGAQAARGASATATHAAGAKHTIACLKRALLALGVIRSAAVAPGTPALAADAAARFDEAFAALRSQIQETIGEPWVSLPPSELEVARPGSRL